MQPIQTDPNHQGNSFADTTPQEAQANALFAVRAQVAQRNAAKIADFEVQWERYVQQRDARPDATNILAPDPAFAEAVFFDPYGNPYINTTSLYVTQPRIYTPVTRPSTIGLRGDAPPTSRAETFMAAVMLAEIYGKPIEYAGMKFLRIV